MTNPGICTPRTANRDHACRGDDRPERNHAPGCPRVIRRGTDYIEFTIPQTHTRTRHSFECARAFLEWKGDQ